MTAYEYLQELQTTIGARLSGSPGETQALAWLEGKLREIRLTPERDEFMYQPERGLQVAAGFTMALGIIILGLASVRLNPWLVALGVVALLVLETVVVPAWLRSQGKVKGYNLLAGVTRPWREIREAPDRKQMVILCAHYDTARGMTAWQHTGFRFGETAFGLATIGVVLLIAYCVAAGILWTLQFIGVEAGIRLTLADWWRMYGMWFVLVLGSPATVLLGASAVSRWLGVARLENPGADDNGSGVASVLAVANRLTQAAMPQDCDVVVAFWGAEEAGLIGSRSFIRKYKGRLDPARTVIINLDGVGRGSQLGAIIGQGVIWRYAADESLVRAWEQACERAEAGTLRMWMTILTGATDQAAWLAAGFTRSLSITSGDPVKIPVALRLCYRLFGIPGAYYFQYHHLHSPDDSLAKIRPESLEMTVGAIAALCDIMAGNGRETHPSHRYSNSLLPGGP